MKVNTMITLCAAAVALILSSGNVLAQDDGGGPGGPGGFGGPGGGGLGGGNFDPAQMQQFMLERIREQLGVTNDADWSAIQPFVQKVMDAQRGTQGNMGRMFGRGGPGGSGGPGAPGGQGGPGGFGQQQSDPAATALEQAIDNDAPASQIKDLLAKYKASHAAKQAALAAAQDALRKVLSVKQEAQATIMDLLN